MSEDIGPASLVEDVAQAYAQAVRQGADMREAAGRIESMRAAMASAASHWDAAPHLTHVAAGADQPLFDVLIALRDGWIRREVEAEAGRLATMATDPDRFRLAWHQCLGHALSRFRPAALAQIAAQMPPGAEAEIAPAMAADLASLLVDRRWREAGPALERLAACAALSPAARAAALGLLAQIRARLVGDAGGGEAMAEAAARLAPDFWFPCYALGLLAEDRGETDAARALHERARDLEPQAAAPVVQLAKLAGDPLEAEDLLAWAARRGMEPEVALDARIERIASAQDFEVRASEIEALVERAGKLCLDTAHHSDSLLSAARAFQAKGQDAEAVGWLDRAAEAFPGSIEILAERGHLRLNLGRRDAAERDRAAIARISPAAPEEAWLRYRIAEAARDWDGLLAAAADCMAREPDWREAIVDRVGTLADELAGSPESHAAAEAMLGFERDARGPSHEATFRNKRGHLAWRRSAWRDAAHEYALAVAASPVDEVLGSNLARAVEKALASGQDFDAADLDLAAKAAPDNAAVRDLLGRLEQLSRLLDSHGDAVLRMRADATRIRVGLSPGLVALLVEDGALRPEALGAIEELRRRVREEDGFTLPGIRFTEWCAEEGLRWRVEFPGLATLEGAAPDGAEIGHVLGDILAVVHENRHLAFGCDEAAELAAARGLDALPQGLLALLSERRGGGGGPAHALLGPGLDATAEDRPAEPPRLVMPEAGATADLAARVQAALFERTSVLIPLPLLETAGAGEAPVIAWRGTSAPLAARPEESLVESAVAWLASNPAALLDGAMLDWLIAWLAEPLPKLVETVRALTTPAVRLAACRRHVEALGQLHLPAALEAALLGTIAAPGAQAGAGFAAAGLAAAT